MPTERSSIAACVRHRYGGIEIGNRGGIVLPGVSMATPLEAC